MSAQTPRDLQAEQDHAEWRGWSEAQLYAYGQLFSFDEMADAFTAGMQAQRDLNAVSAGQQLAYDEDREADEVNADDGRHPDGCTCQFCREDEREERDREELDDDIDNTIPDTERGDL